MKYNKEISDILRKQLELLAERSQELSKVAGNEDIIADYSRAMCEIVRELRKFYDALNLEEITDHVARQITDCIR